MVILTLQRLEALEGLRKPAQVKLKFIHSLSQFL